MANRVAKRLPSPTVLPSGERDLPLLARTINNTIGGQLNVVGEVMVAAGTTETWIKDPRIGPQSFFCFQHLQPYETGPHIVIGLYLKERGVRQALFGHQAPTEDTWIEYMVIG